VGSRREEAIAFWGYDPQADIEKLDAVIDRFQRQPAVVRIALLLALGLVALAVGAWTR
jgi:hypothetical protein